MTKILGLSDEKLKVLYNKYNYNNIIKRYSDKVRPFYHIPVELVINTYESDSILIYDDSKADFDIEMNNWVGCNSLSRILQVCCNITAQEYFDVLILHINDTDDRPKCFKCGKDLNWSGRITAGYGSGGHPWESTIGIFCSQECSLQYRSMHPTEYITYNEYQSAGGAFGMIHHNESKYGLIGFRNPITHIRTMESKFKHAGNESDICYFYITRSDNKFKFGITSDPYNREIFGRSFNDYSKLRIIVSGTRYLIAELEASIKLKFHSASEYIEWDQVPKFIEYFGESYNIIFNN